MKYQFRVSSSAKPGKIARLLNFAACFAATSFLSAATFTWDGNNTGTGNANWSGAQGRLNWVGDVAPDNNGTADLIFSGTFKTSPNMNVSYDINSITFNTGSAFTLNSGVGLTLTLRGGGIANSVAFNQTINLETISLAASQTWNAANGGLTFGGTAINLNANALTLDGANAISIANAISGTGSLTKNGAGTATLTGANNYSGDTVINSGTLSISGAGALGSTAQIHLNGGYLQLNGADPLDRINDAATLIMNGGTLAANGLSEGFGNIDLRLDSFIDLSSGGQLTFAGAVYSAGTLFINGWTGTAGEAGTGGRIIFSTDPGSTFLENIVFTGFDPGAIWLAGGEIVPVPEVNTAVLLGLGFLGVGAYRWNSRRKKS